MHYDSTTDIDSDDDNLLRRSRRTLGLLPEYSALVPPTHKSKMATPADLAAVITAAINALNINKEYPKFNPTSQNITDWLTLFEKSTSSKSGDEKIGLLPTVLLDSALSWYTVQIRDTTVANRSWTDWKAAIKAEFGKTSMAIFNDLMSRNQLFGEDPVVYYRDVLSLCSLANTTMAEAEKVHYLLRGLLPHFKEKIVLMMPSTTADFLEKLRMLTTVFPSTGQTSPSDTKIIEVLATALTKRVPESDSTPALFNHTATSGTTEMDDIRRELRNLREEFDAFRRNHQQQSTTTCQNCTQNRYSRDPTRNRPTDYRSSSQDKNQSSGYRSPSPYPRNRSPSPYNNYRNSQQGYRNASPNHNSQQGYRNASPNRNASPYPPNNQQQAYAGNDNRRR